MKKLNYNLPVSYSADSFDSERFMKLRVKVMHAGLNLNNSNFDLETIEAARPTLANIPLLAFIKKVDGDDSNSDFAGHEYEIKITENDVKFVYLGRPIGIIPETNNYSVELDEDGKVFVSVDAYVWKDYANSALDILNRDEVKKVSMEIIVDDYEYNESFVDIKAYKYTGVALLGEDVREAMIGAKAEIVKFSENSISSMMEELATAMATFAAAEPEVEPEVEPTEPIAEEPVEPDFTEPEEPVEPSSESEPVEPTINEPVEPDFTEPTPANEPELEPETFTEQEIEIANLMNTIKTLEEENSLLKAFKEKIEKAELQAQIDSLFEEFNDLEEEELAELKQANYSYEELEIRLFALRGKKVKIENKTAKASIGLDFSTPTKLEPIYADLVRQKRKI